MRREQALALVAQGGYPQVRQALDLIEHNLENRSDASEDQRLKALFLGMQPGGQREAIRAFDELARQTPATPVEKYLLAQLYEAVHDPVKAGELFQSVVASEENNPLYLASFVRNLLNRGKSDLAETWLAKLEKRSPREFQTVELRARWLAAQGRAAEAVALLQASSKDKAIDKGRIATVLEAIGEAGAADAIYQRFASEPGHPERILARAGFLGRRHQIAEALDLCASAWQTCPPEEVGSVCVQIVVLNEAGPEAYREAERQLGAAIQRAPTSLALQFDLATLHIYQGRLKDAEVIYRQIATRDASKSGPLNNLAWLLAVQEERGSEALELINRAITLEGAKPGLRDTRALAYLAVGQSTPAIKDLEEAISLSPSAELYFHLARAYALAGRQSEARTALQKAKDAGFRVENLAPPEQKTHNRLLREIHKS